MCKGGVLIILQAQNETLVSHFCMDNLNFCQQKWILVNTTLKFILQITFFVDKTSFMSTKAFSCQHRILILYGCNDHIENIGNLTSPKCQSVNVSNLFDQTSRRHRSHGSIRYNKPEIHNVSFDSRLPFFNFRPYFVKEHSDSKNKYTEDDIVNMLEFLVDSIFVVFGGKVFQKIVGILMGTNCAPLLADIFLYSYEAEFIQSLLSTGRKKLASQFNFTYRYIDDVLSINKPDFENYLGQMYPAEL